VEIDLMLMRAGSWLLHLLPGLKWLSLPEIVDEFEKLMTKQVRVGSNISSTQYFNQAPLTEQS
jgi:aarF domain-containing kinase